MLKKKPKSNLNSMSELMKNKKRNTEIYKLPALTMNKERDLKKSCDFPSLSISNDKTINKDKININSNFISFTETNNKDNRNSNTMDMKYKFKSPKKVPKSPNRKKIKLEKDKEKLKNLLNCFRELTDTDPNTKYSIKEENLHLIKKNTNYRKEISNAFTYIYRISRHQQKLDVIKLNTWDEDNLESFYGNTNILYQYLYKYYKIRNNTEKLNELEYYKRIIDSNGNFVDNILKSTSVNNKAIQIIREQKNMEQGSILHNIISKTHYRFRNDLFTKNKNISLNFGIDNDAFDAMKKKKDIAVIYGKVIKEKEKQENVKREELMNLAIKILNKKKEKSRIAKGIGKYYEEANNILKRYHAKIRQMKEDREEVKKHYHRRKSIPVSEEELAHRNNSLKRILNEKDKLGLQIIRANNDLSKELKNSEKNRIQLVEELEICKKELLFMKISHIYLTKEQRNYYLDLLKKGYDIRNDGLVWIVKRLLEIQTKLEYHHFPKYLDKDQADYIIEMANINLEEAQLKIVIDVLQKKQNLMHNKFNKQMMKKILVLSQKRKTQIKIDDENLPDRYALPDKDESFKSKKKIDNNINDIYQKYSGAFRINNLRDLGEERDKEITEELKLALLEGGSNGPHDNLDDITELLNFLNKDKNNKDYFQFIFKLKLRMRFLAKKKENLKKKQLNLFKESLDNVNRFNYAESSLKYDLIWGALFGNNIIYK